MQEDLILEVLYFLIYQCVLCMFHFQAPRPLSSQPAPKRKRVATCQICGEIGHYKKTCPRRPQVPASSSSSAGGSLPPLAQNSPIQALTPNTGIATPRPAPTPLNVVGLVADDPEESSDDSGADDDEEAAENAAILDAVEEEIVDAPVANNQTGRATVIDLTSLEWEEAQKPRIF